MSTVTEIKEVLSQLPEGKWQKIKDWMNQRDAARQFTDDGFDIEATKTKLQAAARGKFRKWTDQGWQRLHDSGSRVGKTTVEKFQRVTTLLP